jgi:3-isopropylmalate/(R)-2-methylmalate dehydratase large subunit
MPQSIISKVWDSHIKWQEPGYPAILGIDLMLIHEVTSAQAFAELERRGLPLTTDTTFIATLDHSIPTRSNRFEIFDDAARSQVEKLRENCRKYEVPLYDFGSGYQGIVHVIGPELGLTQPGRTIVCGDSHTATHGAFGALAFGIGTTEVLHVLAAGGLLMHRPKEMRVNLIGTLPLGVFAKDIILKLIADIGVGGATGHVIEYAGDTVGKLRMDERMTICNMSIEGGARAGLMSPDEITLAYIKGREFAPKDDKWEESCARWRALRSDEGCAYDKEVTITVNTLEPMVTWGTNPAQATTISSRVPEASDLTSANALQYVKLTPGTKLEDVGIEWAFLGSCTNGRIEDLRIAANILSGRRVADGVTMYVVPGSERVREAAIAEGLDKIFTESGASFRMPGCSMCLGMNDDLVPKGRRCISSSNRNFVGRQGSGSITHLASPATVAASAIRGKITSPLEFL